jgi:hypothetical protein
VLFLLGLLPALITIGVRCAVTEAPLWEKQTPPPFATIFTGALRRTTIMASLLATTVLFAYWGLFTWLPGFLAAPTAQGGAGLGIVRGSAWILLMQAGAFVGYNCFGLLADRLGRRPAFAFYVSAAALLTVLYGLAPRWAGENAEWWLLALGPFIGCFGTGFFSLFGAMLAELYPTAIRGTGQGFVYNCGRGFSALAPWVVGGIADRAGLGSALLINSAFFLCGAFLVYRLPETRGTKLI